MSRKDRSTDFKLGTGLKIKEQNDWRDVGRPQVAMHRYQPKARMRMLTDILSRTVLELSQLTVQILLDTAFLNHPLGASGTTYDVHLGKRVVDFLLVLIELFARFYG